MNNKEIARIFQDIADIMEYNQENPFKIRAYRKIAHNIYQLPAELENIVKGGQLREIPGVGDAIEKKIIELLTTGKLEFYERLKNSVPPHVLQLLSVPGIGPKTLRILIVDLGINSLEDLENAVLDGRVSLIPHIGEKGREKMLNYFSLNRNIK